MCVGAFLRQKTPVFVVLLLVFFALIATAVLAAEAPLQDILPGFKEDGGQLDQAKIQADMAKLPLSFIANAGQADENVRFLVEAGTQTIFFTPKEVVFAASEGAEDEDTHGPVVRLRFRGANEEVKVGGGEPLPGIANYFLGNDPEQWRANVPTCASITYHNLYPSIDLIYSGKQGRLKSEFVVAAGADPTLIIMEYSGATSMYVREDGALVLETPIGELVEAPLLIYQMIGEERVTVEGGYRLLGEGQVAFTLGNYVPTEPLIIDPTFIYSTYLGGSNDDRVRGIAVDGSGNAYIIGETYCGDFPTQDPLQPNCSGKKDAFVAKLNPAGSALIYSTYLGGSDTDSGFGIKVDSSGNAYITGTTMSVNFPAWNSLQPELDVQWYGSIVALAPLGASFIYSTYLGGSGQEDGQDIAVDTYGNAYIAGWTNSRNYTRG